MYPIRYTLIKYCPKTSKLANIITYLHHVYPIRYTKVPDWVHIAVLVGINLKARDVYLKGYSVSKRIQ